MVPAMSLMMKPVLLKMMIDDYEDPDDDILAAAPAVDANVDDADRADDGTNHASTDDS